MLLFAAIVIVSCCLVMRVPVELHAQPRGAVLWINYGLPDASPKIVESTITQIIESACSAIPQLKKMQSVSGYGEGSVQLSFASGADIPLKRLEVAAAIRRIKNRLPADASYPLIEQEAGQDAENSPLLIYTITGSEDTDPASIKANCELVFTRGINGMQGVKEILLMGATEKQVTIYLDEQRCRAWGINTEQVRQALKQLNGDHYPGIVTIDSVNKLFLHVQNEELSPGVLEKILISAGKTSITLGELARISIEDQPIQRYSRVNGKDAVTLFVFARRGENKLSLAAKIRQRMRALSAQLPPQYQVRLAVDDTDFLSSEMQKNFRKTAWSLTILLIFLLIVYRNWRLLVCLTASLLVSMSLAFLIMFVTRIAFDLYTIAGLVVSFGMVMDNSIVMLDYFHRFRSKKIITAVMAATGTTAAVVSLVFLLPEEQKSAVGNFAAIVIICLLTSVISALFFLPGVYQILIKPHMPAAAKAPPATPGRIRQFLEHSYMMVLSHLVRFRVAFFSSIVLLFGLPLFLLPVRWTGSHWYNRVYQSSIGSDKYQMELRPYTDVLLGGTFKRFADNIRENSGYRPPEKIKLYLSAQLPYGTSPGQMNSIIANVEKYLLSFPGIAFFVSNVYSGQQAAIEINFKKEFESGTFPYQLKEKLIHRTSELAGADWLVYGIGQGFSNNGGSELPDYRIVLRGYNYQQLELQGNLLAKQLSGNRRIQDINIDERFDNTEKLNANYLLTLNLLRLSQDHADSREVISAVNDRAGADVPTTYASFAGHYYPLVVQASGAQHYSVYDLMHNALYLDSSRSVTLRSNAQIEYRTVPNIIHKEDRQYIRILSFHYMGSLLAAKTFIGDQLVLANARMPAGYTAELKDTTLNWKAKKSNILLLLALLCVIYLICAVLFENLRQPVYIITLIPISFIGLFLVFAASGTYFDQGGYCAFLMVGGLVANAAIFIVNDINHAGPGITAQQSIICDIIIKRSRTIVLSTLSTCCGLLPFLFGGTNEVFWYAFAIGTIAGLIFSIPALFIVLPVLLRHRQPAC